MFEEEAPKEEVKAAAEGEEPAPDQPVAAKKSAFNPRDFKWTASDRKPKNLPQLFVSSRPNPKLVKHEVELAKELGRTQNDAIAKSLDRFSSRILEYLNIEAKTGKKQYLYQQIIFSE